MARKQNRILPMEESLPSGRRTRRRSGRSLGLGAGRGAGRGRLGLWLAASFAGLLVVAYVDGGEEPLRPIVQEVQLPEGVE